MAQINVKDISSIMMFCGPKANDNALALENRQFGYEDEIIGVLTKTTSNDSMFNKVSKEIFVETTPKYKNYTDLTELAYSYINNKSAIKQLNEMYLNDDININFKYDYDIDLSCDVTNISNLADNDIKLYLSSLNNSLYNKLKYYAKNNEVDYITYNGIKYQWQKPGTILKETYIGKEHNIGNDYVFYELNTYSVHKQVWDEVNQTYIPQYNEIKNSETGEVTREPIMENQYSIKNIYKIGEIIEGKMNEIAERYNNTYKENDFNSYYLYNLNNKLSFITMTYSFGKQTFNVYSNYDGEFNNWFNNKMTVNVKDINELNNTKLADVVLGENYWVNLAIDENNVLCDQSIKYDADQNIELVSKVVQNKIDQFTLLSPYKVKKLDLSVITGNLIGDLDLISEYDKKINCEHVIRTDWFVEKGTMLEELIIGKEASEEYKNETGLSSVKCDVNNIIGLDKMVKLKHLNIRGCNNLTSVYLNNLSELKQFNALDTSLEIFEPAVNSNIEYAYLPDTIESIIMNNVNVDNLYYNVSDKLTSLDLNNVTGLDTHAFVVEWLSKLAEKNLLTSGLINYVKLNNVNWNSVLVDTLVNLKNIELKEFTGNINIVGTKSDYITRLDYRLLHNIYGAEVFNENNNLKFNYLLDENAFNVELKFELEKNEVIEEVETTTYEEVGNVVINMLDNTSSNSLLNDILLNPDLYNRKNYYKFIDNNKKHIGLSINIDSIIEYTDKSEKPSELIIGDILFYVDKLIIITKNTSNVNTNYIKLGNINNFEELSRIVHSLENDKSYFVSLKTLEVDHNEISESETPEIEPETPENNSEEI